MRRDRLGVGRGKGVRLPASQLPGARSKAPAEEVELVHREKSA